ILLSAVAGQASDVALYGNYAYVCERANGMRIVNVTAPANPTTISLFNAYATSVVVTNGYVFVCDGTWVDVVAVSNPSNAVLATNLYVGSPLWDPTLERIVLNGDKLYIPRGFEYGNGELQQWNISIPTNPVQTANFAHGLDAQIPLGAAEYSGYVYVADGG